jgi:(R)-2-hydroxyacyl-CoA dehydratese activating ATPase
LGEEGLTISAMCTVFAESEVIGLINRGEKIERIARALHQSVVKRITGMFNRIGSHEGPIMLTGGGSLNSALRKLLEQSLRREIVASEFSPVAGALGCALAAAQPALRNQSSNTPSRFF